MFILISCQYRYICFGLVILLAKFKTNQNPNLEQFEIIQAIASTLRPRIKRV